LESSEEALLEFQKYLIDREIATFIRRSRGRDVMAACGQLALLDSGANGTETAANLVTL
jgi:adenine C2-methylase RlmN of 23S rRNA A2503 and tRNA A37